MPSDQTRERSIARLRRGYLLGRLETETFERRVDCALRTQSTAELAGLTRALPAGRFARAAAALLDAVRPAPVQSLSALADRTTLTIGRAPSCTIVFGDDSVSRRHAEIERCDGVWAVRDLASTNGTYVNGRRLVGRLDLRRGDLLTFGNVSARF